MIELQYNLFKMEIQISESFPLNFIVKENFIKQKMGTSITSKLNWNNFSSNWNWTGALILKYILKLGSTQKIRLFSHYTFRIQVWLKCYFFY